MSMSRFLCIALVAGLLVAQLACQRSRDATGAGASAGLQGMVKLDGSSTVFPISEAVAEEFQKVHPGVRVTVGISGTGGGFKKFGAREIDIAAASRPITDGEEAPWRQPGTTYVELPVAYDGIAVVANPKNTGVTSITMEELKRIWQPESVVKLWSDLRPELPNQPIRLYGPGTDSGTFDYFTEAVVGKAKSIRTDFTASEDDNVIAQGVAGDLQGMGYFGVAYYAANKDRLKVLTVDAGHGAVLPTSLTIRDGSYPLARPLFLYISSSAAQRSEVAAFVQFYLTHAKELVPQVGYIPLSDAAYQLAQARFEQRTAGSVAKQARHGVTIESLLGNGR